MNNSNITILPGDNLFPFHKKIHNQIIVNSRGKIYRKKHGIIGWTIRETVGMATLNPKGISKINKSTMIGKINE